MNIEEELTKQKAQLKMIELKLDALITLLKREGILTQEELDDNLDKLVHGEEDE